MMNLKQRSSRPHTRNLRAPGRPSERSEENITSATSSAVPLRRNLLVVAAIAVALPLLVVYAALAGFGQVRRSHEQSIRLLTAQQYQQDADMMHDAIHADVLEAMLPSGVAHVGEASNRQRVRQHVAQLGDDLRRLNGFALPGELGAMSRDLGTSLTAYGAQAEALVDLASSDPARAFTQLAAFDGLFHGLESPQASLTSLLAAEAARANTAAVQRESQAVRWTAVVAAATLAALLGLAYVLNRIGTGNARLLRQLHDSRAELESSNEQLEAAQGVAHVGSWEWRPTTGEMIWSAELYRILGLSAESCEAHDDLFLARVHPDDLPAVLKDRAAAVDAQDDGLASEYRIVRPDGSVRDVQARAAAIRDDAGQLVRLVGTMQDVTEHRAVERMKDEFVSVISHELRTPLTSIRGALGLLAGGAVGQLSDKAQRMAEVAVTSSDRLVRLINDILDVEKMAAGKLQLELAPYPVADLIAAAVHEMRAMADQAGVVLDVVTAEGTVLADKDRVMQTLTNLLSNAVKFSPEGGVVTVGAAVRDGSVHFTVADQGRGIPATDLEAIFERFQQVDASDTRERGGTGLGLPICRGIVEQHGGRIWVTSEEGRGSTFEFTLPRAGPDSRTGADVTEGLPVGAVLICDDDPAVVEVLAMMLETHGYETLRAHSGAAALDLASHQAPSVILMDLLMPGMSGWDTIAELNANPATADIPVVILSALGPHDTDQGTGSDWLTKPIDIGALLHSLRRALGTEATANVVVIEDDPGLGEVLKAFFVEHGVHTRVALTGRQALSMTTDAPPDMVVLDLGLPDIDGFAVVEALRQDERLRSVPLVVYTGADLTEADRRRLRLGETRFVAKGTASPAVFERQVIGLLKNITGKM